MKRRISKIGSGVVVLLLVVAAWWAYGLSKSSQGVGPLSEDLGEVIIPAYEVNDASIDEAVAQLERVVRAQVSNQHLRVLLWESPGFPAGFRVATNPTEPFAPVIPGLEPLEEGEKLAIPVADLRWSLKFANIPLSDLMRYVSGMYDCTIGQQGNNLYVVKAKGRFGRVEKKVWKVNYPEQIGLSSSVTTPADLRGYLETNGARFHEGDSAVYYPRSRRLVVRAFQDEIDLVDALFWECSFRARTPTKMEVAVEWLEYYRTKVADAYYKAVL